MEGPDLGTVGGFHSLMLGVESRRWAPSQRRGYTHEDVVRVVLKSMGLLTGPDLRGFDLWRVRAASEARYLSALTRVEPSLRAWRSLEVAADVDGDAVFWKEPRLSGDYLVMK